MKRSFITALFVLTCLLGGTRARAEVFVDIYAGGAFTDWAQAGVIVPPLFFNPPAPDPRPNFVVRDIGVRTTFDDSFTYGLRAGYWFGLWFGMAVDAFTFEPNLDAEGFTDDAEVRAIPISLLFLFRYPFFRSETYPLGRLHPYAGAGPSIFITDFEGDVDLGVFNFPNPIFNRTGELSSSNVDPGLEVVAGLDFEILPFVGVFGEYRYSLAEPVWSDNVSGIPTDFQVPLRTHHFVGGLTFRF